MVGASVVLEGLLIGGGKRLGWLVACHVGIWVRSRAGCQRGNAGVNDDACYTCGRVLVNGHGLKRTVIRCWVEC